jgi:hypothetical protein
MVIRSPVFGLMRSVMLGPLGMQAAIQKDCNQQDVWSFH